MRTLRQLSQLLDALPIWAQLALAAFLVTYSLLSIYGRANVKFGAKLFSRIPENDIRDNKSHVLQYTVIPALVTLGYLALLFAKE